MKSYPFDDHHPPVFSTIKPFCDHVHQWLTRDPLNVAVVHCKAGKGRTGVMVCCYLLHSGRFSTAEEVLSFYGKQRTIDHKGVTIPSQRRYISYYAGLVREQLVYEPVKLSLRSLVIDPVPTFGNMANEFYLQFEVRQADGRHRFESPDYRVRKGQRRVHLVLERPLPLCGDVKIEFTSKLKLLDNLGPMKEKFKPNKEFHFWFNTFFVTEAFSNKLCHTVGESLDPLFSMDRQEDETAEHKNGCVRHNGEVQQRTSSLNTESANSNGSVLKRVGLRSYPPPDRHVSYVSGAAGALISEERSLTNLLKHASISDDHLLQQQQQQLLQQHMVASTTSSSSGSSSSGGGGCGYNSGSATTVIVSDVGNSNFPASTTPTLSFTEKRRHCSVPQTASSPGGMKHISHFDRQPRDDVCAAHPRVDPPPPVDEPGESVSIRLTKPQIDKAFKDKSCKVFADNFQMTLLMLRPTDQRDATAHLGEDAAAAFGACVLNTNSRSPDLSSDDDTTDSEVVLPPPKPASSVCLPLEEEEQRQRRQRHLLLRSGSTGLRQTAASASSPLFSHSHIHSHSHQSDWV